MCVCVCLCACVTAVYCGRLCVAQPGNDGGRCVNGGAVGRVFVCFVVEAGVCMR